MKYKVKTQFVFEGEFEVEARSSADAEEMIQKHCGLVIGGDIHTTLPDDMIDWDFATHPTEVHIGTVECHTYEWCPKCDVEVKLADKFEIQSCPNCGQEILPCSICDMDKNDCTECKLEAKREISDG